MDKQTTIAFILIGAILVLWLYISSPDPKQQPKEKDKTTAIQDSSKLVVQQKDSLLKEDSKKVETEVLDISSTQTPEEFIYIETDLARFELSNKGANFRKIYLSKFNNWYSAGKKNNDINNYVQLIDYKNGGSYDLSFVSNDGKGINTKELTFASDKSPSTYKVTKKDSLIINYTFELGPGKYLTKTYTFFANKYEVKSDITFTGFANLVSNNSYDLTWNNGVRSVEKNSVDEANYSNSSVFYGDEQVIVDASSVGEKEVKEFRGRVDWLTVRNKYFAVVIIPDNPQKVEGAYIEGTRESVGKDGMHESYDVRLTLPFQNQNIEKRSFKLFIGPVDIKS
jgi:YidC/Oxa1 family membrane protein insertase